jgi:hypothetical protein
MSTVTAVALNATVPEGLTRREIVRCLKRYLARRLYPIILADLAELT